VIFAFRYRMEEYCIARSYWISVGLWCKSCWHFRHDSSELHEGCFLWKVKALEFSASDTKCEGYLNLKDY